MIPAAARPACPPPACAVAWAAARDVDPVVGRYRRLFAQLDWSRVPEPDPWRPRPGRLGHPPAAYVKALLVKLEEGKAYVTELRRYLVEHPLLVLELGFRPVVDPTQPLGFDVGRTVPGARWLRHQQQTLAPALLSGLLAGTVRAVQAAVPGVGATVAVDVKHLKHLYAWVAENNPTAMRPHRFDPQRPPRGDPACRLGVKRRANTAGAPVKEYLWGYGSGIATATDPRCGDVVRAEVTQPFHHQDVTYYHPVYAQATAHLGHPPTNVAAAAAFAAWHVYQTCAAPPVGTGGIAAIARNRRGPAPPRDAAARPLCDRGLAMTPGRTFRHEDGFRAQDHHCPLRRPTPTGAACPDPRFPTGGCHKVVNLEPGGLLRAQLDRASPAFHAVYRRRTSAERINSQAAALGIDRPKVRCLAAVRRLATLTYVVINARVLTRLHDQPPPLC